MGCLPADGGPAFDINVFVRGNPGKGTLALEAGHGYFDGAREIGGGLFRARYRPAKVPAGGTMTLRAVWKQTGGKTAGRAIVGSREVRLCPLPVGRVVVRATPEKLLAGKGQQAFLHIEVIDSNGKPLAGLPLEIAVNVGRIKNLSDLGDGSYEAVYLPPGDPYPQVAIIMVANPVGARLDRVAVARAVIPITARIELPGKTAPGTSMEMTVAGRKFGPARADEKGDFRIPILVPPGYGKGRAMSVDRVGNRRRRWINLFLPETNQLGLWAYPRKLPADGRARSRLLVTTIDPYGKPTDIGGVRIKAGRGKVSTPKKVSRGLFEAFYTAPAEVGDGHDLVEVHFPTGGHRSLAKIDMRLLPGLLAGLSLEAPRSLPADGKTNGEVIVKVHDKRGNPVAGKAVTIRSKIARVSKVVEQVPGIQRATISVAPDPPNWTDRLKVEVRETAGGEPDRLLVCKDSLSAAGGGGYVLRASLVDGLGRPVIGQSVSLEWPARESSAQSDEFGLLTFRLADIPKGAEPVRLRLECSKGRISRTVYLVSGQNGARLLPIGLDAALLPDKPFYAEAELQIYPAGPLDLRLDARPAGKLWIISARLVPEPVAGEKRAQVVFAASAGKLSKVRRLSPSRFEVTLDPGQAGWGKILVSASESISHVGAVREIVEGGVGP